MVRVKISETQYFKPIRIKIYPNTEQAEFIDRCIELNRYIYNWVLDQEELQLSLYKEGKVDHSFVHMYEMDKRFTELRNSNEWLKSIPHNSGRSAIRRAIKAYHRYFDGTAKKPVYKTKKDKYGKSTQKSYTTRADRMFFEDNMLRIEGLSKDDMIYTKYHSGLTKKNKIKFYSPVVSRDGMNNYWISFSILCDKPLTYFEDNNINSLGVPIGIDLNIKKRIVLSNGKIFYAPDISKHIKKTKRLTRKHHKDYQRYSVIANEINNLGDEDIPYSNRAKKRLIQMHKEFNKIHNINMNFVHTSTKQIIDLYPTAIVMENLDITNSMMNKHYIASQMAYANFYKIREVMEYKCKIYGIPFILAPKNYESTQICSCCGNKKKMYSHKVYICKKCGARIDRDINAAINLSRLAMS